MAATLKSSSQMDDQEAKWIHRDKLTQIEIQEYLDRGMQPPTELLTRAAQRGGRSINSRQARRPDNLNLVKSQEIDSSDFSPVSPISPIRPTVEYDEPFIPEDPRSPDEIAEELNEEENGYAMGKLRSSSSKIPLATSSPLPVPIEHLERDTPLRRKRGTSEDWDDENTPQLRMRSRGNSISSQILLDDDSFSNLASPRLSARSQAKAKAPSSANKIVNGKTRNDPGAVRNASNPRPNTRGGGANDRPRTGVARPEGDPPWIAQMYQPDPMLPPDQQMLPTHAKKLMAEQWEKEGKRGAIYDRELTPVQLYDETRMKPYSESQDPYHEEDMHSQPQDQHPDQQQQQQQQQQRQQQSPFKPSNDSQWPLRPTNLQEPPKLPPNLDHGGYSTMPKVQKSPSVGVPPPSPRRPEQQFQVEPEKAEKEKGGCGCCVVM